VELEGIQEEKGDRRLRSKETDSKGVFGGGGGGAEKRHGGCVDFQTRQLCCRGGGKKTVVGKSVLRRYKMLA